MEQKVLQVRKVLMTVGWMLKTQTEVLTVTIVIITSQFIVYRLIQHSTKRLIYNSLPAFVIQFPFKRQIYNLLPVFVIPHPVKWKVYNQLPTFVIPNPFKRQIYYSLPSGAIPHPFK